MASTITLNTIPIGETGVTNFVNNVGLSNNTLFASTLREIVTNARFASLFAASSIDASKLALIPGNQLITKSLSGSSGLINGGQIAWYSIDALDIASAAIDNRHLKNDSVGNSKLFNMAANTIKVNNTADVASPADLAMAANSVVGRSGTGNVSSLVAGNNAVLRRDGTGNLSFGLIGANNIEADAVFARGMIMMWSGTIATIPTGWGLCNGATQIYNSVSTVTPDLRDRFIVGARQDAAGEARTSITGVLTKTGGTTSHAHAIPLNDMGISATGAATGTAVTLTGGSVGAHTLTVAQMPVHDHAVTVTDPGHVHSRGAVYPGSETEQNQSGNAEDRTNFNRNTGSSTTGITVEVDTRGGGQSHTHSFTAPTISVTQPSVTLSVTQPAYTVPTQTHVPPYFALAFIIKL